MAQTINGDRHHGERDRLRRLRALRRAAGMTQRGLSARCAELGAPISDSQLSKIERGIWSPRPAALRAIADALSTSPGYLLGETDNPDPDRIPAGQR